MLIFSKIYSLILYEAIKAQFIALKTLNPAPFTRTPGLVARVTRLELAASAVTGRRSNQLSYTRAMCQFCNRLTSGMQVLSEFTDSQLTRCGNGGR